MSEETHRPSSGWRLAIDFGTTFTAAAVERGGRITSVLFDGSPRISSVVAVDDTGTLVVGGVAEREMARAPERAERCPKRRIGDAVMLLGDQVVSPVDAVAAVLKYVFDEAVHQSGGARPGAVILTHPARWGAVRLSLLEDAARRGGLPEPQFVAEPVAAAAAESEAAALGDGQAAAVFDLGGGTFDTAVVRRTGDTFEVAGPPGGNDRVGGEAFDERLFVHLGEQLAQSNPDAWERVRFSEERTWRRAAYDFRLAVRSAKEALSTRADAAVYLGAPIDAELRLTRDELERLIAPDLHVAVAELAATVESAGLHPAELRSVFLVGGSSRVPLAARLVGEWFGRLPVTWGDPKGAVVIGALMVGEAGLRQLAAVPPTGNIASVVPVEAPEITAVAEASGPAPARTVSNGATAAGRATRGRVATARRRPRVLLAAVAAIAVLGGGAVVASQLIGDSGTDDPRVAAADSTGEVAESVVLTTAAQTTVSAIGASTTSSPAATTSSPATTSSSPGTTSTTTVARVTSTTKPSGGGVVTTASTPVVTPTATTTTTTTPTTAPPPATTTTTASTTKSVPNVITLSTSQARSALEQVGFEMSIAAGSCQQSSEVVDYSPKTKQELGTVITVSCAS